MGWKGGGGGGRVAIEWPFYGMCSLWATHVKKTKNLADLKEQ